MTNMSLADQAVETLAMVRTMDADMTNDRPELRRAERNLTAIEAEARAIATAMKATP